MCALLPVRELATERATPGEKWLWWVPDTRKSCTTTDHDRLNFEKFINFQEKNSNIYCKNQRIKLQNYFEPPINVS